MRYEEFLKKYYSFPSKNSFDSAHRDMEVYLAFGTDKKGNKVGLGKEPTPVLVVGRVGTGKTTLVYVLIISNQEKAKYIIFDIKGDYSGLLNYLSNICVFDLEKGTISLNPLQNQGIPFEKYALHLNQIFSQHLKLPEASGSSNFFLSRWIELHKKCQPEQESLEDLLEFIEKERIQRYSRDSQYQDICKNRLEYFIKACPALNCSIGFNIIDIIKKSYHVVFRLPQKSDISGFIMEMILTIILLYRQESQERTRNQLIIICDEAKMLFPYAREFGLRYVQDASSLNILLANSREYNLRPIFLDQSIKSLAAIIPSISETIVLFPTDGESIFKIGNLCGFSLDQRMWIMENLETAECIMKRGAFLPIYSKVKEFYPNKDVSQSEILRKCEKYYKEFSVVLRSEKIKNFLSSEKDISEMEKYVLISIAKNPLLSLQQRRLMLKLSNYKYNIIIKKLVMEGYVSAVKIRSGTRGGQIVLLDLLDLGVKFLKENNIPIKKRGKPGIAHYFYCEQISKALKMNEYKVYKEAPIRNLYVDVLGIKGKSYRIAVELELSNAENAILKINNLLKLNLINKIVFTTDNEKIFRKVRKEIEREHPGIGNGKIVFCMIQDILKMDGINKRRKR